MLASTVLEPNFLPWELEEAKGIAKQELEEYQNNHQLLLQELSHPAAYGAGSPLGPPKVEARALLIELPALVLLYLPGGTGPQPLRWRGTWTPSVCALSSARVHSG